MLHNQNDTLLVPLWDGEDLAMFDTFAEAENAAEENPMGQSFGYEIFEEGCGR